MGPSKYTLLVLSCACMALLGCGPSNKAAHSSADAPKRVAPPLPEIPTPIEVPDRLKVTHRVLIETTMGAMVVGLYGNDAPATVKNFLSYVDKGFYEQKVFHRVIPGFMIQGGGFDEAMVRHETDPPIKLEIIPGLKHEPGTFSMARTNDPHSATAQFFVSVARTPTLNGAYAIFGKLEEGFEVAADISAVKTELKETERGKMEDVPSTPVLIQSIKLLE